MRCEILTLFPEMVEAVLNASMLKRACDKGLLDVHIVNLRDYAEGPHKTADDAPYGGGAGMVLKPEPVFRAVDELRAKNDPCRMLLMSPQGRPFNQQLAEELANERRRLVFLCGHYEGIDERVRLGLAPEELSVGDYVLTGGELAALVVIDAAARLVPGVLGDPHSAEVDSFSGSLLDYPHYTRPPIFRGMEVPEVLRSGNHQAIEAWRRAQALQNTYMKRPDLLDRATLTSDDRQVLHEFSRRGGA
ncbi:MAG: tRNA (guanosine(37)-N1)-methyltransferase TrmD [Nitrospirae bacterium]|nr:MAG: tRNA (guanosine(37)-N1)-methyltransferase TrmD [Nitrospirota bacterium]